MARKLDREKKQKSQIVAFKVEDELAEFLDKLPNKSEFIRKAILAQFAMNCPLCAGTGVVEKGVHDHFDPVIAEHNSRPCDKCKAPVAFPLTAEAAAPVDRDRISSSCTVGRSTAKCYPAAPPCHDCGWHVMMERVAEHFKKVHSH